MTPPQSIGGGNMSFWVEPLLSYLGVVDAGMVLASLDNTESDDGMLRAVLSSLFLTENWATVWGGLPLIGDITIPSCSAGFVDYCSQDPDGARKLTYQMLFEMAPAFRDAANASVVKLEELDPNNPITDLNMLLDRQVTLRGLQKFLDATGSGDRGGVGSAFEVWAGRVAKNERSEQMQYLSERVEDIPVWYSQPTMDQVPTSQMQVSFRSMYVSGLAPTDRGMNFGGATSVVSRPLTGSAQTEATLLDGVGRLAHDNASHAANGATAQVAHDFHR